MNVDQKELILLGCFIGNSRFFATNREFPHFSNALVLKLFEAMKLGQSDARAAIESEGVPLVVDEPIMEMLLRSVKLDSTRAVARLMAEAMAENINKLPLETLERWIAGVEDTVATSAEKQAPVQQAGTF